MITATIDASVAGYIENESLFLRSSFNNTEPLPDAYFVEGSALRPGCTSTLMEDNHIRTLPVRSGLQVESHWQGCQGILRQDRWWRPPGEFFFQYIAAVQPAKGFNASFFDELLGEILYDLWLLPEEAVDEGIPVPPYETLRQADRLIRDMFTLLPMRFEVYATEEASVEVDAPNLRGSSVIVSCTNDGMALCTVNIKSKGTRADYTEITSLPNSFLQTALQELIN